ATLCRDLDTLRRAVDRSRAIEAMDRFQGQAPNLLTSSKAAQAFDLNRESPKLRERYGRNTWGQQLLMARRLVEAGVEIITTELTGPLCRRVQNGDDHAGNHHVFEALKYRAPLFAPAVTALIEALHARALHRRVAGVVR